MVFQSLFNFGWKVADQTNKFEFLDVFCFFWYPCWLQKWRNSWDIVVFILFIDIFWLWRHLAIFFIIFKIKPNVSLSLLVLLEDYFGTLWLKITKKAKAYIPKLHKFERNFGQISQCVIETSCEPTYLYITLVWHSLTVHFRDSLKCTVKLCQTVPHFVKLCILVTADI